MGKAFRSGGSVEWYYIIGPTCAFIVLFSVVAVIWKRRTAGKMPFEFAWVRERVQSSVTVRASRQARGMNVLATNP